MQTLTERMGDDMRLRGFAPKTQHSYRSAVAILATFEVNFEVQQSASRFITFLRGAKA